MMEVTGRSPAPEPDYTEIVVGLRQPSEVCTQP